MKIINEFSQIEYDTGVIVARDNGKITWIRYNTGDEVWFKNHDNGTSEVVAIDTYDGISWDKDSGLHLSDSIL